MAWTCSGTSNLTLVQALAREGLLHSERIKQAMLRVDRANYASFEPYRDSPQQIGHGATISAPHMHVHAAEYLLPCLRPGAKVLDIGSGSGYLTHVLAELVSPGGTVVGIDHIPELVELSEANTRKSEGGRQLLESGAIKYVVGDGRLGHEEGGPYDAIHVGACARNDPDMRERLARQIKAPGRMFIPIEVENHEQNIHLFEKNAQGVLKTYKDVGVRYVPLTDAPK